MSLPLSGLWPKSELIAELFLLRPLDEFIDEFLEALCLLLDLRDV